MRQDQHNDPAALRAHATLLRGIALNYRNSHMPEFAADCEQRAAEADEKAKRLETAPAALSEALAGLSLICVFAMLGGWWIATPGLGG